MIIIIDDDPISSKIAALSIKKGIPNNHCVIFNNPEVALNDIRELQIAQPHLNPLLLIDINMPEINGFEFLDLLTEEEKSFLKDSKIIMLSSSVNQKDIERAKTYPIIRDFVSKPLTVEYIRGLVGIAN